MGALLSIYWLSILSGIAASLNLASLGVHLATRDRAMQTLCLSQGATFGVLLGMGIIPFFTASEVALHFGPIVFAIASAIATSAIGDRVAARHATSRNTYFISLFAILLGAGYLVTALFPSLENHLTQVYFGDLATMSDAEALFVLLLSMASGAYLVFSWRAVANASFEIAAFGPDSSSYRDRVFGVLSLVSLCASVQFLGLLFTVSLLFLPTVLLRDEHRPHLKRHLLGVPLLAAVAALAGFVVSLGYTRLPTVPTIVLLVLGFGLLFRGFCCAARKPATHI